MSLTTFVCASDTHTYHRQVKLPEGDILLHTGDFTFQGFPEEVQSFLDWCDELLSSQRFAEVVIISGNHDLCFGRDLGMETAKRFTDVGVHYLQDSSVTLGGIKIYGAPHTPTFGIGWAFNKNRGSDIASKWALIPEDAEVVMTHGPPMFFGDLVDRGHVGCFDLLNRLDQLPNLKVHCSGHLHEGYGSRSRNEVLTEWDWLDLSCEDNRVMKFPAQIENNYKIINASTCTRAYKPTNPPLTFTL